MRRTSPGEAGPGAEYDYEAAEHVMGAYSAETEGGRRDYAAMKVERAMAALRTYHRAAGFWRWAAGQEGRPAP